MHKRPPLGAEKGPNPKQGMSEHMTPLKILSSVEKLDANMESWTLLEAPADDDAPRVAQLTIQFAQAFESTPVVHVGLAGIDIENTDSARVRVRAVDITPGGFVVQAETWLATKIWEIDVSWLALGS